MVDLYHKIYDGEIFKKSNCIWHENTLLDFFRSVLLSLGYQSVHASNKVWRRGEQTVVVCLVDDFTTCSDQYSTPLPYLFDRNTVVITDNRVNVPTQYQVRQLPPSFFGIYKHTPALSGWEPQRRFNFAVNRMDAKRMLLFLEIQMRAADMTDADTLDYSNFNCWSWDGDNTTTEGLVANFQKQYQQLEQQYHQVYDSTYQSLLNKLPYRNHSLDHETAHVAAWINIVMETYSSDTTVAMSEKLFRALCLPVPWMTYSGKHTVAYLNSLGFDVMQDLVEHRYDNMIENKTAAYGDKMVDFVFEGADAVVNMQSQNFAVLEQRCQTAAAHNQELLDNFSKQWPADFAAWLPETIKLIS